jgi:hypothetical protein
VYLGMGNTVFLGLLSQKLRRYKRGDMDQPKQHTNGAMFKGDFLHQSLYVVVIVKAQNALTSLPYPRL